MILNNVDMVPDDHAQDHPFVSPSPIASHYRTVPKDTPSRPFTARDAAILRIVEQFEHDYVNDYGDLADSCDVELQATANTASGTSHGFYVAILDELRARRDSSVQLRHEIKRELQRERDARRDAAADTLRSFVEKSLPSNDSERMSVGGYMSRNTDPGTPREWCPRVVPLLVNRGDESVYVQPECGKRTCKVCSPRINDRDVARVLTTFGTSRIWLSEILTDDWQTTAKRIRRHGSVAVKMPNLHHHDRIIVLSSEPITPDAIVVTRDTVRDVVTTRPTGIAKEACLAEKDACRNPRENGKRCYRCETCKPCGECLHCRRNASMGQRPAMTGVGLPTVNEWEQRIEDGDVDESVKLHRSVTADALTEAAERFGIDFTRQDRIVQLHAEWDDPRMQALRKWGRNPIGEWEMWLRASQGYADELPLEMYEPPPEEDAA